LLCYEDDKTNRLKESLEEFEKIINSEWFQNSLVILVMNKCDLFKEKIKKVPLKNTFDNFDGGDDLKKNTEFIENLFKEKNKHEKNRIYSFFFTKHRQEGILRSI